MKSTTRDGVLRGGRAALIRLLILAAGGISAYLLSVSLSGGRAVGCGPGSGCDEVLGSRWAYVLGVPVSALALVVDLAALVTSFSCGSKSTPKQRRGAWEILLPCAVLILGGALWFTALQAFVLQRFCPWCLTAHACGSMAAILLLTRLPLTGVTPQKDNDPAVLRGRALKAAVIATVAVAVLGVAQVAVAPKTSTVTSVPAVTKASDPVVATNTASGHPTAAGAATNPLAGARPAAAAPVPPLLNLFGGRYQIDLLQVPVWGSPGAPNTAVKMFDYTCYHCRDMHPVMKAVFQEFSNQLAIVSLPMPFDSQCNYTMRMTPKAHTNACLYAKLGLLVWRAKHDAILPYDEWFFSFKNPPPLADVTNKVVELVGQMAFDAAARDAWADLQVGRDVDLYAMSAREFKNAQMPQFIIGTNLAAGTMTVEQLRAVVQKNLQPGPVLRR